MTPFWTVVNITVYAEEYLVGAVIVFLVQKYAYSYCR